jgi:NADH:ubiquinone oxidoreductase subunit 2 (subunit N)
VTAVLVGATKAGVFVALLLTLSTIPKGAVAPALLGSVISLFAVATMTTGNILALAQTDLRRVLAYSSIAQMGYILLAIGIGMQYGLVAGILAGLFYLVAYGVMKAGAFLAADALATAAGSSDLEKMRGVGARHPVTGIALAIFVLGLVGVPATAGFLAKLLVFQAGMATLAPVGVLLALILAANSAVSLGYYAPILSNLLFGGRGGDTTPPASKGIPLATAAAIVALALATVLLGLFPQAAFAWIEAAASQLFVWGVT